MSPFEVHRFRLARATVARSLFPSWLIASTDVEQSGPIAPHPEVVSVLRTI